MVLAWIVQGHIQGVMKLVYITVSEMLTINYKSQSPVAKRRRLAFLNFHNQQFNIWWMLFLMSYNLFSCNSQLEKKSVKLDYDVFLEYNQLLEIMIDSVSSYSPFKLHYQNIGYDELLLAGNKNLSSIDVYSINNKKLVHRLFVNDTSTLYTTNIHGFWPKSKDSIFVYSYQRISPLLLILKNWKVVKRKKFNVINPFMKSDFLNHASMTASPSLIIGNEIYYTEFPIGDVNQLINSNYSPEIILNYHKDSVYNSGITWPKVYQRGKWDDLFLYCKTVDNKNRIIYSWEASNNLFVRENDTLVTYLAKSDFFDTGISYDPNNVGKEGRNNSRIEQNHYMMILYDKYNKVYYRFAVHGIPSHNEFGIRNTAYDAPFSVIILDQNLNKIGETFFPSNKYLPKDSFVGRKGLYISNMNSNNLKELDENSMSFSLFVLTKK